MSNEFKTNLASKIVEFTVDFLVKNSLTIDDLEKCKLTRKSDLDNIWNEIAFQFFQNKLYKNSLKLYYWWKRDDFNFKTNIKEMIKQKINQQNNIHVPTTSPKKVYNIFLTIDEWSKLQKSIAIYSNRKKFKTDFDDFLSDQLNKQGVFCRLRCIYNWFKNEKSQKIQSFFWRGSFKCTQSDCNKQFKAIIKNGLISDLYKNSVDSILNSSTIKIVIETDDSISFHKSKVEKKIRCSGIDRRQEAIKILAKGITNVQSENILNNNLYLSKDGIQFNKKLFLSIYIF
jgi:hypothetical protein